MYAGLKNENISLKLGNNGFTKGSSSFVFSVNDERCSYHDGGRIVEMKSSPPYTSEKTNLLENFLPFTFLKTEALSVNESLIPQS